MTQTSHDAVAFVLGAQPPMGKEHELQQRRERYNQLVIIPTNKLDGASEYNK